MEPTTAILTGGAIVLAAMGLVLGCVVMGRSWGLSQREAELDTLQGLLDIANATIASLQRREVARAAGAAVDLGRATDLAGAAAAGDIDRVLRQFPGDPPGVVASEHGGEADPSGGQEDDPA